MKIEVIGPGCPFCKTLYKRVNEVVKENQLSADVQHLTDFNLVMKYFPMTPILIVDGEIRHRGKWLPKKDKIKQILMPDMLIGDGKIPHKGKWFPDMAKIKRLLNMPS